MDEQDDEVIEQIAQALRDEPMRRLSPSFDARVMASIKWSSQPRGTRALVHWMMRPRRVAISPVGGLAAAAVFLGVAYVGAGAAVRELANEFRAGQQVEASAGAATLAAANGNAAAPSEMMVQFVLVAPDARSVSVVGDFNDWNTRATPLHSTSGSLWTVQVPLPPGRHNYIFVVDGTSFVVDPAAPRSPVDDFGQSNSVITVGGSSS